MSNAAIYLDEERILTRKIIKFHFADFTFEVPWNSPPEDWMVMSLS